MERTDILLLAVSDTENPIVGTIQRKKFTEYT